MAEDHRGRGLPTREIKEESEYPPIPGEEEDRRSYPQPGMAAGVTLPSFSQFDTSPGAGRYPPDPRGARDFPGSPASGSSYPPPPGPGQERMYQLPPVQHGPPGGPGQGPPGQYGGDQRGFYPGQDRRPYADPQYGTDPAFGQYSGYQPGAPPGPQYSYPVGAGQAQAAPRQRTSIACRYCRKRKIRCSGYQNTPDGKCTNCKKTGNECVFQPVSSSSSTAFVPVSAVPGGVPPGTQLFGAFGQPLAGPQGGGPGSSQASYPPPPQSDYPLPSPTNSAGYYQHPDERAQPGSRRSRPIDEEQSSRLPPPNPYMEESDPRRRSPASMQGSTPPQGLPYPRDYDADRRRNSPGGVGQGNVMRLENMLDRPTRQEGNAIDQNMLGRLNRSTHEGR